ncbi:ATPase, T2SS/T4P/T4SS family [Faecalispora sporosphaeroides]|uniref:ATPase, T2SS/T4P/T4SS family n=1 Tax=Faecalispora sporosphaeroides TaxID=1549 RepID=UPI00035D1FF2|nr:ATPase, T2SS/T4P/T4SS family [Faecalispora sporosphaeroides]
MSRNLFQTQQKCLSFAEVFNHTQNFMFQKYKELLSGDAEKSKNQLEAYTKQYLTEQGYEVEGYSFDDLVDKLIDEMTGFSFLSQYLDFRIKDVEEININSWNDIKVTFSDGRVEPAVGRFYSPNHALNTVRRLLSRSRIVLDDKTPCVRGHLNKKIRITVNGFGVIDEDVGVTASIRFINPQKLGKEDFISFGTATEEMLDFLSILYRYGISMCLAGPTGTGKTTIMSWIMSTIPNDKRLYTVENGTREFDLPKKDDDGNVINNVIHTCTRYSDDPALSITQQMLLEQGLTFNPDYFCLAEMKGSEAYETQEAARTGHAVISTVHAISCDKIYDRILDLCSLKGNLSDKLLSRFVVDAFPITFFIKKMEDNVRRITEVCECSIDSDGTRKLNRLYQYHTLHNDIVDGKTVITGKFERVGVISTKLQQTLRDNGIPEALLQNFIGGGEHT